MQLRPETIAIYFRQALSNMESALDRFDDTSVNIAPHGVKTTSAAGLIVHSLAAAQFWMQDVGLGEAMERDRESEFVAEATVAELRSLLVAAKEQLADLAFRLEQGPTAVDHEVRLFLHEDDGSDGSVVLHTFEELFQHLGHLELTADAVGAPLP